MAGSQPERKESKMAKEEPVQFEGIVTESIKGEKFRVEIPEVMKDGKPFQVMAYLAGKLRLNNIEIVAGDKVKVEVSPYDPTNGRITFRLKG